MAPMDSSDSEVKTCSKSCLKNYESLKKQYDDLVARKHETEFKVINYKRGLDTVEAQLVTYRKNEVLFSEEVDVLKREVGVKQYEINMLKTEFEKVKQEKEGIEFKIKKFENASKDLDKLLGSQITNNSKKGLGYNADPPPHPLIYNRPNKLDLSYSGLEEFQQPEFKVYGLRANKSGCENSSNKTKKNYDAPLIEEWVSDNEDEVESPVVVEKKTVVPTIPKVNVIGNEFVMNNKACFACGSFNHLIKDCKRKVRKPIWNNARRVNHHNSHRMSYPHPKGNFVPKAVLMKNGMRPVNVAKPKATYNAVKRNRFNVVKASACWVWMPKNRVVDHVSKNIREDMKNAHINEDHFCSDGCTGSGEARVQQRKRRIQRRVQQKQKDQEDEVFGRILSAKKMKLVLIEENSSYCSRLQLPILNQSVNTVRITAVGEKVNAAESLLVVSTEVNAN
ncbi:putative ribonuclease H-like domain-containing protein [Tanacetum coccineum]